MTHSRSPDDPPLRTYVVCKDDSLSSIAEAELGARERWRELHALNRDVVDDPDSLHAGQVLRLPPA